MAEIVLNRRNWMPWAALLLGLAAIFSNIGFFIGFPGVRALPLLSVALGAVALVCAAVGMLRAFRQQQVYGGKVSSSILGVVTLLLFVVATFIYVGARKLPPATEAPQVGQKAPDFTLADTNNKQVSLAQLLSAASPAGAVPVGANAASAVAPKYVLLIFYRGYW